MPDQQPVIAVLGSGSWGTALAILLSRNGAEVRLWGHLQSEIDALVADGENRAYIPGIPFPDGIKPTTDLAAAVNGVN
ncbi:MAG: 2-dehydropantoate 2-reductase N-terminal domain-containing protein, partial [Candidatus Sedimenticola sp. 6PFRAG1]